MSSTPTKEDVIEKLKEVNDPEIGIDIWTLGLVYSIDVSDAGTKIIMTLTSAFCPFADMFPEMVRDKVAVLYDDKEKVTVDLTFDPPWKPSDELRMRLGLPG